VKFISALAARGVAEFADAFYHFHISTLDIHGGNEFLQREISSLSKQKLNTRVLSAILFSICIHIK
jgi:hypothetical protein